MPRTKRRCPPRSRSHRRTRCRRRCPRCRRSAQAGASSRRTAALRKKRRLPKRPSLRARSVLAHASRRFCAPRCQTGSSRRRQCPRLMPRLGRPPRPPPAKRPPAKRPPPRPVKRHLGRPLGHLGRPARKTLLSRVSRPFPPRPLRPFLAERVRIPWLSSSAAPGAQTSPGDASPRPRRRIRRRTTGRRRRLWRRSLEMQCRHGRTAPRRGRRRAAEAARQRRGS
mmetsp:Transcript_15298/g.53312  ORF Transcript_15298/g.53312 Transcript_15298/m.53312 type:complete len:225 (-) Transcript_15298:614-1288(-)